jgi:hypothetical protein
MTIPIETNLQPLVALLGAAASVGLALAYGRRFVHGTTLVAPWRWSIVALAALAATELGGVWYTAESLPGWMVPARFIAAMATFCPVVAVLGAKRPQDRAWQLIVLSLWFVLSLPALQDVLYHYGQGVSLDAAWRWFIAILIAVAWVNYLPTRHWPSGALYGVAQIVLLADFLPWPLPVGVADRFRVSTALALFGLSGALVAIAWPRRRLRGGAVDRLWSDFRDSYGMLWSVRIRDRATSLSRPAGSPSTSEVPSSCDARQASIAREDPRDVERALIAHLQRFVSREWIDSRLTASRGADCNPAGAIDDTRAAGRE